MSITKISQYFLTSFLVTALLMGCVSADKNQPKSGRLTLKQYFKNPEVRNLVISPDGTRFAALRPYKSRMNLFVKKLEDKKWQRLTEFTDRNIAQASWKGNDFILFSKDNAGDENFHVYSVNLKTNAVKDLTNTPNTRASIMDNLDDISENEILIDSNQRDAKAFDVYRLNIETGEAKMIFQNPGNYVGYLTDHNGQLRIATSFDGVNTTLFYRDDETKPFKKVRTLNFKQKLAPIFFDFDNKNVYAINNVGWDKTMVILMNPQNGRPIKSIYSHDDYDVMGVSFSKKRKELLSAFYIDWKVQNKFFSNYYKDIFTDLESKISDKEISLVSSNKDETLFTVFANSDRSRGKYYFYNAETKELKLLEDPSPWLDETKMAEMKPISYKSRDGLTINGYLTLPPGTTKAKNLPLIVNPHGGPWSRDVWGFNPEIQFLASRGYAVLQMNFRGSTGYGRKFWEASFKEWGKKMQDDVTDGVKWAIDNKIAAKNRICIYGGSYGGYATLAGLTFTPDLYKCGVDYVGVSNLFTFMETIPPYWEVVKSMLYEMVGHPERDKKLLESSSPIFHIDKIKASLFVAQGANDPRVKQSESDQIVKALREKGIDVPYMLKKNEGHGFHNEENLFEFYEKMEAFIRKNLFN